jgi:hypothetical protein
VGCSHLRVYYAKKNSSLYCKLRIKASHGSRYKWDNPRGVLKFAVNSSMDTMRTFTSLRRWGKHASVDCQQLDQGRLTWWHDSVLNHIADCLKSALVGKSTLELYCDFNGLQAPSRDQADQSRLMS